MRARICRFGRWRLLCRVDVSYLSEDGMRLRLRMGWDEGEDERGLRCSIRGVRVPQPREGGRAEYLYYIHIHIHIIIIYIYIYIYIIFIHTFNPPFCPFDFLDKTTD